MTETNEEAETQAQQSTDSEITPSQPNKIICMSSTIMSIFRFLVGS